MRTLCLAAAAAVVVLAQSHPATAGEKKLPALVSPPVSLNPNEGQPLCLVSNLSAATTVTATVEILDGTGAIAVTATLEIPPGGIDGTTDVLTNFYSYCRITPQDASQLPLLRGSHCAASGNTARTCVEAR